MGQKKGSTFHSYFILFYSFSMTDGDTAYKCSQEDSIGAHDKTLFWSVWGQVRSNYCGAFAHTEEVSYVCWVISLDSNKSRHPASPLNKNDLSVSAVVWASNFYMQSTAKVRGCRSHCQFSSQYLFLNNQPFKEMTRHAINSSCCIV